MSMTFLPVTMPLEKFVPTVNNWWPKEAGGFQAAVFDRQWDRSDYLVSEADLLAVHPLLPSVIRAMLTWEDSTAGSAYADGSDVHATLRNLRGEFVTLQDTDGRNFTFSEVREITENLVSHDLLTLHTTSVRMHDLQYEGQNLTLVKRIAYAEVYVSRQLMDAQHPGWSNRWKTAEELGLSGSEAYSYVFLAKTAAYQAALPVGITLV